MSTPILVIYGCTEQYLSFSSLNLIITVHNLAIGPLLGMALIWGLCTVAVSCGYPFLRSPLGGEPRLVVAGDAS